MKHLQTTLPGLISAIQSADSGSFSAAANALGLTPAAVSKNVAALEAHLKLRLFNRTTRRLALTEEGRTFIAQARIGMQALEDANALAAQGAQPEGLVRVNSAVGFGRRYVLPLLPAFFKAYPQVRVELNLNDNQVDLVQGGFDVGIRGGSQPPEGMVARKICNIPAVLAATPRYLKAHGIPQTPSDLAQHQLIRVKFLNGRMPPWPFKGSSKAQGISAVDAPAQLLLSDPEVVLDAALLHIGIARLGRHHASEALARGDLVEVLPKLHVGGDASMALFYPHRAGLAPRVRVLVDFLLERFKEMPPLRM
ncbi:LysR family transcriptional regulator [Variovorax sp. PCZ-1]|uniref:LysR family transcriptional regulator n=1 Tax=Variovorax sp. PCZ-1 TaxID=2835533 RepID=UPI001BCFEFD8|nr:LysR family transcriptional regulator [Variovorax sp. PCZ-1]MBS7809197.1 LysR family transcriptional regulator [Variovorax sp. PCZ-1]